MARLANAARPPAVGSDRVAGTYPRNVRVRRLALCGDRARRAIEQGRAKTKRLPSAPNRYPVSCATRSRFMWFTCSTPHRGRAWPANLIIVPGAAGDRDDAAARLSATLVRRPIGASGRQSSRRNELGKGSQAAASLSKLFGAVRSMLGGSLPSGSQSVAGRKRIARAQRRGAMAKTVADQFAEILAAAGVSGSMASSAIA